MKEKDKKLICIVGATASGKTGLGVELAKRFDGEIVSADSRQIYCRLDIGTGKEGQQDPNSKFKIENLKFNLNSKFKIENLPSRKIDVVEQWLIDICEPEAEFNMFDWLELAKKVLDDIWSRGKVPIVVGGTGLYVQALVDGFTINKTKEQNNKRTEKQYTREELDSFDLKQLRKIAKKLETESQQLEAIDQNNPRRVIRFIERVQAGELPQKTEIDFDYVLIGRNLPRAELYEKIDKRVDGWFCEGFYEEVEGLLNGGVSAEWLNKIGLEYKILANYIVCKKLDADSEKLKIEKFASAEEIKQRMKYAIHQYARRQLTWWRRFDVKWVKDYDQASKLAEEFIKQKK